MMHRLGVLLLSCLLAACTPAVHEAFTQSFVDANRGLEDDAWSAAYSPELKVLAVGRESGRLELWDTRKPDTRLSLQAHELRTQDITFGAADGIVISRSNSGNLDFGDIVQLENGPKIWDARSGELLHAFREPDWLPGAASATPEPGLYLLASYATLHIYDHARRALAGEPLDLAAEGGITSIDWDKASGLIAAGTDKGVILLLRLHRDEAGPRLEVVDRHAPYGRGSRKDILLVRLLDEGTRLVTVQHSPERAQALRDEVPPLHRGSQHETVRWELAGWRREHVYSSLLVGVHQAGFTRGEEWLVLAGVAGGTARIEGKVELLDLRSGMAWLYKANTTHASGVLLPPGREGLVLGNGRATRVKYLDQADSVPWSPPR